MKKLLTGNEAVARGAFEAGVKVGSAYPGTPSTEIFENLAEYKGSIYSEWAPNEKVAAEVAYGASIAGVRSILRIIVKNFRGSLFQLRLLLVQTPQRYSRQ